MKSSNVWHHAAWFIIFLVLTLPFYSANALAVSVQVTRNSGQQQISGYLDANGDTWTVEATIAHPPGETVDPAHVKLKIGTNEASFQSCSTSALGVVCQYLSPLSDGVREAEYAFQVVYDYLSVTGVPSKASGSDVIRADGSGPSVEITKLRENTQGQVDLDFTVSDKVTGAPGAPAVGIKTIEIVDGENNNVLQTISIPRTGVTDYIYSRDSGFTTLQASLAGEGRKRIKVQADDWLGHKTANVPVRSFESDFINPVISDTLNFVSLGKFIGQSVVTTDLTVDVLDTNLESVKAYSDKAELNGEVAVCTPDEQQDGLQHCVWKNIEVSPVNTIAVTLVAQDSYGNSAEKTISKSFTADNSPPQIVFFGTERTLEGKSYIKSGSQRIIMTVMEEGAGVADDGILADLSALGKSAYEKPICTQQANQYTCYWDTSKTFSGAGVARIRLSKFQDKVGNEGTRQEVELLVDTEGPKVTQIDAFGVSEVGEKNYFQSNDKIKLKILVSETTAPVILVNVNGIVMDAAPQFPETVETRGLSPSTGWQVFHQDSCEKKEAGTWECTVETTPIKSGPDQVHIDVRVQDVAGNDAMEWPLQAGNVELRAASGKATLNVKLLGLSTEENPDYWEVVPGFPKPLAPDGFIDLDTVMLGYSRVPLHLKLQSSSPQAKVLRAELTGIEVCTPTSDKAPQISRVLLAGGNFPEGNSDPTLNLILEFAPFDGRQQFSLGQQDFETVTATYTCHVQIYSMVNRNALRSAEVQEVKVTVPFGFSSLGSLDENIAGKIKDIKESGFMKFSKVLGYLNTAFTWLHFISNMFKIIVTFNELYDLFGDSQRLQADTAQNTPITLPLATALRGACFTEQYSTKPSWELVQSIQSVVLILNCNPQPADSANSLTDDITLSWYGKWQRTVLDAYNIGSGRGALGVPAQSLYENMYTSAIGLCLPGILFNVNKAREIQCRKIICYGREVPAGIATMDSCDKLYDLQMCEFVYGPLVDFTPLGGIGYVGSMLKSSLTSPLGLVSLTEVIGCAGLCWTPESPGWLTACKVTTGLNKVLTIIDSIISTIDNRPSVQGSPYCDIADKIKVEELAGQVHPRTPTEQTTPAAPAETPLTTTS